MREHVELKRIVNLVLIRLAEGKYIEKFLAEDWWREESRILLEQGSRFFKRSRQILFSVYRRVSVNESFVRVLDKDDKFDCTKGIRWRFDKRDS